MIATGTAPMPPADLPSRSLPLEVFSAGRLLHRIHTAGFGPIYFDKTTKGRFNAPDCSYGVLYVACNAWGAVAESLLRNVGETSVSESFVTSKAYARLRLTRDLRAVQLRGPGQHTLGVTSAVSSVFPYDVPQAWSKALYDHLDQPDAIVYRSRHNDDELCLAIFDRAMDALEISQGVESDLLASAWFLDALDANQIGFSPT